MMVTKSPKQTSPASVGWTFPSGHCLAAPIFVRNSSSGKSFHTWPTLKLENLRENEVYVEGQVVLSNELLDDGTFSTGSYENVDHVKGNTDAGFRWVQFPTAAKRILERAREINPDGEYIFMYKGKQLYTQTFNEHLKKYCEEAGIDPKGHGSHSIRFTVASILYLNGTPIQEIQRLLGHTSMAMTLHYLKDVQPRHKTAELMEKCL